MIMTLMLDSALGEAHIHPENMNVSSIKKTVGDLLSGTGVIGAIFPILAIKEGLLPPTTNLEVVKPEFNLN